MSTVDKEGIRRQESELEIAKAAIRNLIRARLPSDADPQSKHTIPHFEGCGSACERLRSLDNYRKAAVVFVAPDSVLAQARINALNDSKILIVATPGLQSGFVEFDPRRLPFQIRTKVAASSNLVRHGSALSAKQLLRKRVDLLLTGSVAVDRSGNRLGKGAGFFDLEYALLSMIGAVTPQTVVATIVAELQIIESTPHDDSDVPVDYIITPAAIHKTQHIRSKAMQFSASRLHRMHGMKKLYEEFMSFAPRQRSDLE